MKIKLLFLFIIINFIGFSQISVGSNDSGILTDFDKKLFKKFKNTKTIFLLSDILDKEVYQKILKDAWTVTEYEIIPFNNFNIENYLSDRYSIVHISGFDKTRITRPMGASTGLFTFVAFKMYDSQAIFKKFKTLSPKNKELKKYEIIEKHAYQIASFYLYPKDDFIETTRRKSGKTVINSMYTDQVFLNYKPGFLKNYFQKINKAIDQEKGYAMRGDDHLPSLEKLSIDKLYIPSYVSIQYNGWKGKDSDYNNEVIQELFKDYKYAYEIAADSDISDRIMENEEFYYLRYVRVNGERFIQIIDSKTGDMIYRNHIKSLSYKLKSKYISSINNKIDEVKTIAQKSKDAIVSTN